MNKYEGVELQVHHNNFSSGPALNPGSLPKTPLAAAAWWTLLQPQRQEAHTY